MAGWPHERSVSPHLRKARLCSRRWGCNRVLQLLTEPLLESGYTVLRYNSRGVGKSTGWASFTGYREGEDLKELVQWARSTMGNVASLVIAVGTQIMRIHIIILHSGLAGLLVWFPHSVSPPRPRGREDLPHSLVLPNGSEALAHGVPWPPIHDRAQVTR